MIAIWEIRYVNASYIRKIRFSSRKFQFIRIKFKKKKKKNPLRCLSLKAIFFFSTIIIIILFFHVHSRRKGKGKKTNYQDKTLVTNRFIMLIKISSLTP